MNKTQVIEVLETTIKSYNLKPGDYIVTCGAALVLHGVKDECNDIDITLTDETYDRLYKKYPTDMIYYNGDPNHLCIRRIFLSSWENTHGINVDMFDGMYGLKTAPIGIETSDGFIVQTLESLRNEKSLNHRNKDIEDLKLINETIERRSKTYTITE